MSTPLDVKNTSWYRRIEGARKRGFFNYQDIADARNWDTSPSYEFCKWNRNEQLVPQDKMLAGLEFAFMEAVSRRDFDGCIDLIEKMIQQSVRYMIEAGQPLR
jgi:hypothetical protein